VLDPLTLLIVAPLLAAGAVWLLPADRARNVALLGALACLIAGSGAFVDTVLHPGAGMRWETDLALIPAWGLHWHLGMDGLSAAMLALAGLVEVIAIIASHPESRQRGYFCLFSLLFAGANGVFVALDSMVFYVFWELMLIPMFLLIGLWGGEQRRYAAMKFAIMTLGGSVLMLAVFLGLWSNTPNDGVKVPVRLDQVLEQGHRADDHWTLHGLSVSGDPLPQLPAGMAVPVPDHPTVIVPRDFNIMHQQLLWSHWSHTTLFGISIATLGFWLLFVAVGVKIPVLGLHTWLPHAHVQAPTAVSVVLAALLLKLGVYALIRLPYGFFPTAALDAGILVAGLGTFAILYAGWVALMQRDLKRLVAYSSVSHMGYCLLGLAALTASGVNGAVIQMVTHGLGSALLFLLVGVLYDRTHHRRVDGFGGLAKPMPVFAGITLFAALASAGLPGLAGFVGELLVVLGSVQSDAARHVSATHYDAIRVFGLLACVGVIITAAYLLWMVRRVLFGPVTVPEYADLPDTNATELWCLVPLVVLTVVVGVWPQPLITSIGPTVDELVKQFAWVTAGNR
jgi:NADH-quinone oxidoreductase subunit M